MSKKEKIEIQDVKLTPNKEVRKIDKEVENMPTPNEMMGTFYKKESDDK